LGYEELMADDIHPSALRMCHLTGFTKKCGALVSSRKCERWRILTVEETGGKVTQKGDCIDDWMFYFGIANERGLTQLTASTDKVANHAEQGHTESMAVVLRQLMTPISMDERNNTITLIEGGKDHD
jgi:hypothetical protein